MYRAHFGGFPWAGAARTPNECRDRCRFAATNELERLTGRTIERYAEVNPNVVLAYPFLGVFWSMLVFFVWVAWFILLFRVLADIFRRHDIGGGGKVLWIIFVIVLPFLGVFIYLIAENKGMNERTIERAQASQAQFDDYVRQTASSSGASAEIGQAKQLLDSGAITQAEFDAIKAKALA
jgi:Short C-terminal domain/Phospholipase_D-nuclease N-terminal